MSQYRDIRAFMQGCPLSAKGAAVVVKQLKRQRKAAAPTSVTSATSLCTTPALDNQMGEELLYTPDKVHNSARDMVGDSSDQSGCEQKCGNDCLQNGDNSEQKSSKDSDQCLPF